MGDPKAVTNQPAINNPHNSAEKDPGMPDVNSGNFNLTLDRVDVFIADLYALQEKIYGRTIVGFEFGGSLNFNPGDTDVNGDESDYAAFQPVDMFVDIGFSGKERNISDLEDSLRLSGGFMETAPGYGEPLPILGGGADVYLETELEGTPKTTGYGRISGKIGVLGALDDSLDDDRNTYEAVYSGTMLLSAAASLGLKFNKGFQIEISGLYGRIAKEDGYSGDWDNNFQSPDVYDSFYGVSPSMRIRSAIFNLKAAYHYLNRSGEDHFGRDYNYMLSIEGDKVTNNSHRVNGDMYLRAYKGGMFTFDVGVRANYYTDDREEHYDYFVSPALGSASSGTPDPGYNQMGKTRSYVFPYLRFGIANFNVETGAGPSDGSRLYDTTCADICDTGKPGDETELNTYLKLELMWGEE